MRGLDLKSILVAGAAGAVLLAVIEGFFMGEESCISCSLMAGFAVGAGVQVVVRMTGVS